MLKAYELFNVTALLLKATVVNLLLKIFSSPFLVSPYMMFIGFLLGEALPEFPLLFVSDRYRLP